MAARQPKKVCGVDVVKADLKIMRESATELGLNPKGTAEELIRRITEHFRSTTAKKKLSDCDVCNGDSAEDFHRCPYCGTVDEEAPTAPSPKPHTAEVVPIGRGKALRSEGDLNKSVEKIQKLKIGAAKSVWALGQEIRKNYEQELWKLRRTEDNKVSYRNWKQFCSRELAMSHTHAYKLMDISAVFTEEQIAEIGSSKLGVVLQLPEPHRAKLLQQATAGKSKSQLEAEAKRLKAGKKPKSKAATKDKVSMAVALGRVTIPLLARTKVKGEFKPAKRVGDDPWAEEELENNVKQLYRVKVNAKGEMILIVERRRIT